MVMTATSKVGEVRRMVPTVAPCTDVSMSFSRLSHPTHMSEPETSFSSFQDVLRGDQGELHSFL